MNAEHLSPYLPQFRTSLQQEGSTVASSLLLTPHYDPMYTIPQSRNRSFYVSTLNAYVKNEADYYDLNEMLPLKYQDTNPHFTLLEYISLRMSSMVGTLDL